MQGCLQLKVWGRCVRGTQANTVSQTRLNKRAHLAQLEHDEEAQEGDAGAVAERLAELQLVDWPRVVAVLALDVVGDVGVQRLHQHNKESKGVLSFDSC